jgi:peptide/nickel transport system substrate-binding protein
VSPPGERPTGTVTFLFTDIEGSTRLLKQLRDDYAAALADHQRIVRDALAAHDGWEIDTQGDSFFAAFRRAKDAVGAALDIQRTLAAHEWPQGAEMRVRMGMHTGEPADGGERYVGLGVHRAARIAAAGHGGQVLVSQTTRELLRDDPQPDVSLRDLGEHELKDMDEPDHIYQLVAPGLAEDFAPLKTTAPALGAGREGELVEAAKDTVGAMGRPWHQGRRLVLGSAMAALVALALVLALVLTRGSASASTVAPNNVGVVDPKNGHVSAQVPVGHAPGTIATGANAIWVANTNESSVSRIDPQTNNVQQTIDVGGGPSGVAVGGGSVWVTNGLDGTISRIAPSTNNVSQTITVGSGPAAVAYGDGAVWVANAVEGTVSRVDPESGRLVRTIPAAAGVSGIAVGFGRVWVVAPSSSALLALDPSSGAVVNRTNVGTDPSAVATGAGSVWVVNRSDGTLSQIDPATGTVKQTIPVGRMPTAVAVGHDAVWVASSGDGTLTKVDPQRVRVAKRVQLSNAPEGVAVGDDGVYVTVRSTGRAHRGGTLRIDTTFGLDFIDPALGYAPESWSTLAVTNDGLVAFRRVAGVQGGQLVPDLAEALPVATDAGKTYTFRVRRGIHYSNGQLVQPEDFRRAIERVYEVKPLSGGTPYYAGIVGAANCRPGRRCDLSQGIVTDREARTVTFHLTAADADFPTKLAMTFAAAVPAATPPHDVGNHPVPATGPYMIASFKNGSVKLVRNPRFREWSADAKPDGYPDTIVWRAERDAAKVKQAAARVERGVSDLAVNLVPPLEKADIDRLATRYPGQLHLSTAPVTNYFFLNTRLPPFNDVRARLAVNYALDRQALAALLGRANAATCQIFPPNYPSYRRTCPYGEGGVAGVDKARRLVRASGSAGQSVVVWAPGPQAVQARYMASLLRSIGYRPELHLVADPQKYFEKVTNSRTRVQTGYYGWASDFPSESEFIKPVFSCGGFVPGEAISTTNPAGFCNRALDRELEHTARVQAEDPPAAHALWRALERKLLAQAPYVPTYNRKNVDFLAKRVGNYQFHPQWGPLIDQLWVR